MKKNFVILLVLLSSMCCPAQSVREAWITMPDSLCPYLAPQQRLSMLRYAEAGVRDTLNNALDGTTWIDSLSANQLTIHLTRNLTWQLTVSDEGYLLRATLCAPLCGETRYFYDRLWTLLRREHESPELNHYKDDE